MTSKYTGTAMVPWEERSESDFSLYIQFILQEKSKYSSREWLHRCGFKRSTFNSDAYTVSYKKDALQEILFEVCDRTRTVAL